MLLPDPDWPHEKNCMKKIIFWKEYEMGQNWTDALLNISIPVLQMTAADFHRLSCTNQNTQRTRNAKINLENRIYDNIEIFDNMLPHHFSFCRTVGKNKSIYRLLLKFLVFLVYIWELKNTNRKVTL